MANASVPFPFSRFARDYPTRSFPFPENELRLTESSACKECACCSCFDVPRAFPMVFPYVWPPPHGYFHPPPYFPAAAPVAFEEVQADPREQAQFSNGENTLEDGLRDMQQVSAPEEVEEDAQYDLVLSDEWIKRFARTELRRRMRREARRREQQM
eukprot:CAMPEP_0184649322 /NCGR_PEP_ID=MMETSP0308-20130426/6664_1 /TAXON_ID=38269 /ORGANISM="Gloeochaete witrockiana, Strain SAG 46.84" /LENGTH=155 /DNA_ID=CAMNT_0027081957 /DNA_START=68 /DNA_END=535 /DNA_ORIENTATION=+